jgi:hypothetical protein
MSACLHLQIAETLKGIRQLSLSKRRQLVLCLSKHFITIFGELVYVVEQVHVEKFTSQGLRNARLHLEIKQTITNAMKFLVVDPCMVVKVRSPQSNSVALRVGEYQKNSCPSEIPLRPARRLGELAQSLTAWECDKDRGTAYGVCPEKPALLGVYLQSCSCEQDPHVDKRYLRANHLQGALLHPAIRNSDCKSV